MARSLVVLALLATKLGAARGLFSVNDDILAFPQYEVSILDSYIPEADAQILLSPPPAPSQKESSSSTKTIDAQSTAILSNNEEEKDGTASTVETSGGAETDETYETVRWQDKTYLCSIPVVRPPPPMNATEKEISRAEEEKELARATTRGWELLSEMEGKCLYFISGWWSYSFCHNREIRQFHQLPSQNGQPPFPPQEDHTTASYVLGRAQGGDGKPGAQRGEGTELQGSGELRYLVQKLGGGTTCDLTGKERRIEVQYHCNPASTDRIGFVKEVSICCYLMVIYTPRLCNDVAFLPPREGRANSIQCKEIMDDNQIKEWHIKKAKEQEWKLLVEEYARDTETKVPTIGGGNQDAEPTAESGTDDEQNKKKVKIPTNTKDEIVIVVPEDFFQNIEAAHDEL